MLPDRFALAIRLLHWTTAALIIAMLFIGVAMVSTAGPAYSALLALHRPLGIAILLLACIRLAIRFGTRAPPLPGDLPRAQARVARASHILLYLAMIGLPLIGWAMLSAGSYPVRLGAGLVLPPILPPGALAFGLLRELHALAAFALFALILGHLTAALVHGFVRRDGVLATMGFGRNAALEPPVDETGESLEEAEDEAPTGEAETPPPA
ncbi:cytochrome b [Sphingopyxis sp. RIFCSPHIGHO2_12_FULL_65_19]|uniref:cytochrome b n=1 Tax=Sphingopyxis sp. RIFCSPHIGHO2_12_FULL_65_19 TaxID=1802172 RepID=UPI0008BDD22F|nr:cytochrome b [Sphingopyxis sp. RIFCSPHIGHO2_12_FULL_65_19]OHD06525.1 MAG: cytochrome B [Sphingopyxis sp. RIFCSPHIGHO2_12_FULL_65_19]